MPIMAKSNDEYTEVKAIKTPDGTEIDYVLSKVDNTYKRTYTATRELEGTPPLEFKSIKPNANLTDYRIYGQTSRNLSEVNEFSNSITDTSDKLQIWVQPGKDQYFPYPSLSQIFVITEPTAITTSITITNDNNSIRIKHNGRKTDIVIDVVRGLSPGVYSVSFNVLNYDNTTVGGMVINNIMVNKGSTPLPYEPYGESVGDRTGNLFDMKKFAETAYPTNATIEYSENRLIFTATQKDAYVNEVYSQRTVPPAYRPACIDVQPLTTYTISMNAPYKCFISWINDSFAPVADYTIIPNNQTSYTFTTPSNCTKLLIRLGKEVTNIGDTFTISNIMLNADSAPLPYEPYGYKIPVTVSKGTDTLTTPIYLPEQIKKVGDEAEYIDYGEQKQHIETTDGQEKYVVGLNVDFENKTFTRLADAVGLSKGTDFDNFSAFGGRRRCNVADDGTITAYYGDANYTEDGSNGQVMVYQPAFYYKVEPLKIEAQESGVGYHLRNANYYISNHQGTGFKLHPAFYNEAGDRVDYILLGAYEGCIYDTSANAYVTDDSQVMNSSEDKFSSIANVKPASGQTQNLTRPNLETICKNRGNGWHLLNIRIASMEQLLMIIELGTMNTQTGAGSNGIISITGNSSYNCASLTGSTASLGNASGQAESTISDIGGAQTVETANGKTAYSFRGDENPWGNIWKFVYGVNIWGDGTMNGGVPYICTDFDFSESKNTDNYESAGFSVPNANGYVNALGYSENFDWLMMPSEIGGNASLPVGDYNYVTANLNGYKIARLGGSWDAGVYAGGVEWSLKDDVGYRGLSMGGRLVYIPQIEKQHIYTTGIDVSLPALPTLTGTNVLSVGTEVQPSDMYIKGNFKMIAGGGE